VEPEGIIAVLRGDDAERVEKVARACAAGGIRFIEVTFTVPGAAALIERLAGLEEAVVGAGTVTSVEQANAALDAGARFLVSPACLPEVADRAREAGVPCLLGAMTPTEVLAAWNAGATQVKVFPAARLGGSRYMADLAGPYPDIRLSPSGGITIEDLPGYRLPNVASIGLGSVLTPRGGGYDEIRAQARRAVEAMRG
jgi:2-dehydro-3-deoxyphosphogluconate aldolase / (4S)-4-hydroxy-2-oxoglutarate aldolase